MCKFPYEYKQSKHHITIFAREATAKYSKNGTTPLTFQAITPELIRIHARTSASFAIEDMPECTGTFQDISVISHPEAALLFSTGKLQLSLDEKLHLQIRDENDTLLCADYVGSLPEESALSQEEIELMRQEGHVVHTGEDACKFQIHKQLFGDETIYGLGDKTGFLNKKGYDFVMWNTDNPDPHVENPTFKSLYKSLPFFLVKRPGCVYGIFLDNHFKSFFDMGYTSPEYYSFGAADGELDYYFIHGSSMAEVISSYTALTGRAPLPQLWTLGYHQSRWGYRTAREVRELAHTFRRLDIPCDVIHLDLDYMDNFKVFTTSEERFPDLPGLSRELAEMGIKLVTIIDPGTKAEEGYHMYDEGVKNGYFATTPDGEIYHNVVWPGDSVFPDYTSETVRKWWGDQTPRLLSKGISGIWNDMNEPASFNGPLPDDVIFAGDDDGPRQHKEVHNIFGHLMAKATYEGLKHHDGKRPFVITRACYSGTQKYSTAWTGDNQSIWAHLKLSIPQLLNLGMSGMPIVGTDIGGFGGNTTPELLSRWIEASCFAPLFRNHCAMFSRKQEPWQFDQKTLDIYRKYVKLRYKFIPYMYDLCYQETQTGLPILRPLVLHYEDDVNTWECNDEYLVGDSILMAPVTDQGAKARMVYLPAGIWVDYWTGKRIQGGKYILQEAPLDVCPMYIRGGSVLPTWKEVDSIPEQGVDELLLEYYPVTDTNSPDKLDDGKEEGNYIHYQDNGSDFSYEDGKYNLYHFTVSPTGSLDTEMLQDGYDKKYSKITIILR